MLDLDGFLQEIHSWINLLKQKDEEIEILQRKLSFTLKHNETIELTCTALLNEVNELNNAVASLQRSFRKIEIFEEDRRNLIEEKQKLKNSLESIEKLYTEKNKNLMQEFQKVKEANKAETSKLVSQIKNEASEKLESIKEELGKRENDIQDLKTQISKLLEERDQDILKMKVQYEDKIGKLKQQMPKSRIPVPHGLQMHDIFRQKYLKLEKDSNEEITKLKEQVQTLQQMVASLKSKSGSISLNTALFASNKPSINITTSEVATQTVDVSRQFSSQAADDNDFVPQKKINRTIVVPQKRKLFNLNENYYAK